jgi:hypothetical protein
MQVILVGPWNPVGIDWFPGEGLELTMATPSCPVNGDLES